MIARTNGESTSDSEPDFVIFVLNQLFEPWIGDYFKPWRRKIGLVVLGLACVFAMGWIRSFESDEAIIFNGLGRRHVFRSVEGHFIWYSRVLDLPELNSWSLKAEWISVTIEKMPPGKILFRYPHDHRNSIEYWGLVAALILLSAGLLLSRPRERTHAMSAERW